MKRRCQESPLICETFFNKQGSRGKRQGRPRGGLGPWPSGLAIFDRRPSGLPADGQPGLARQGQRPVGRWPRASRPDGPVATRRSACVASHGPSPQWAVRHRPPFTCIPKTFSRKFSTHCGALEQLEPWGRPRSPGGLGRQAGRPRYRRAGP